MKYHLVIFGCQMNKSDGERIAAALEKLGFQYTSSKEEADLLGVVACSVRQTAVDRIYGQFSYIKKKGQVYFLTGCLLKEDQKKLKNIFDLIFEIRE